VTLLRSNIEFAKRVFLDRLTTDAQPLLQPTHIDEGPGDEYLYAGVFDPYNFGVSADCSGLCGIVLGAALNGAEGMSWSRLFSTETFPGPLQGFRRTSKEDLIAGDYPLKVCIMHGGGGPDSHMACQVDGWDMESNGDYGVSAMSPEITGIASDYWNDWWVFDGPITEDTEYRQPMSYPQGLDYAGGRIAGADLKANGISFVCRYLSSGGASLPFKQLTSDEFADLTANGIGVVFNWETTSNFMLGGFSAGVADAQQALSYIQGLPGVPAGYQPVVYFSCDFDEAPSQDAPVEQYLNGAATVLGGMEYVGIYGAYYICTRAQAAVGVKYIWQTEAWSGGNITSAVNIMQRNSLGYKTIAGVQCDINEQHTDDIGAFTAAAVPTPAPSGGGLIPTDKPTDMAQLVSEIWDQLRISWPQLGNRTLVDAVSELLNKS
jgi:hypothetical protein